MLKPFFLDLISWLIFWPILGPICLARRLFGGSSPTNQTSYYGDRPPHNSSRRILVVVGLLGLLAAAVFPAFFELPINPLTALLRGGEPPQRHIVDPLATGGQSADSKLAGESLADEKQTENNQTVVPQATEVSTLTLTIITATPPPSFTSIPTSISTVPAAGVTTQSETVPERLPTSTALVPTFTPTLVPTLAPLPTNQLEVVVGEDSTDVADAVSIAAKKPPVIPVVQLGDLFEIASLLNLTLLSTQTSAAMPTAMPAAISTGASQRIRLTSARRPTPTPTQASTPTLINKPTSTATSTPTAVNTPTIVVLSTAAPILTAERLPFYSGLSLRLLPTLTATSTSEPTSILTRMPTSTSEPTSTPTVAEPPAVVVLSTVTPNPTAERLPLSPGLNLRLLPTLTATSTSEPTSTLTRTPISTSEPTNTLTVVVLSTATPSPTAEPQDETTIEGITVGDVEAGDVEHGGVEAEVIAIASGDTIWVTIDGEDQSVRYIGVNAPDRRQPGFQAALSANKALLENQTVLLVADVEDANLFGDLLRYVYLQDGTFVNIEMVEQGWAQLLIEEPNHRFNQQFMQASTIAATSKRGFWSEEIAFAERMVYGINLNESNIRLYAEPDDASPISGLISPGETVTLLGWDALREWIEVLTSSTTRGWVSAELLTTNLPVEMLE